MLPLLFSLHLADTKANIHRIFNGNWTVDSKFVSKNRVEYSDYYLQGQPVGQTSTLIFEVKRNKNATDIITKFDVTFLSNGNFKLTQIIDGEGEEADESEKLATMVDLCHNVHPHVSATGYWGNNEDLNYIYNLEVITKNKAQLTLFNQDNGDVSVFNFHKDVEGRSIWIYVRAFLIFIVFFTIQQQISKFVIKRETQRIDRKQKELKAQSKAQTAIKEAPKTK